MDEPILGIDLGTTNACVAIADEHGDVTLIPYRDGSFTVPSIYAVDDKATCDTIREIQEQNEYLLDPHTAIGVRAARNCRRDSAVPMITLGTAHPAKFPDAVKSASGVHPALPARCEGLMEAEEHFTVLANEQEAVEAFIKTHSRAAS